MSETENSTNNDHKPIPPISYQSENEIELNSEISSMLTAQGECQKPFWINKYHIEAVKNWDKFYKRNENRFFKDRHYLGTEFEELENSLKQDEKSNNDNNNDNNHRKTLFEIGCGVGNALFPLIDLYPNMNYLACDCSKNAIEVVKERKTSIERNRATTTTDNCLSLTAQDIVNNPFPSEISTSVDYCTLIFVLSALSPQDHLSVLIKIHNIQSSVNGLLFLRDYALYDSAQLRFGKGSKLGENFYVRQDGTQSYFFSKTELTDLVQKAGYEVLQCVYLKKDVQNRKENKTMKRTFIQLKARARTSNLTYTPNSEINAINNAKGNS